MRRDLARGWRQVSYPHRDPEGMDIIKNKTNMTVEEASKLRNGHGKNLNGGKYVHPSIPENPTGDGLKMVALIVGSVHLAKRTMSPSKETQCVSLGSGC